MGVRRGVCRWHRWMASVHLVQTGIRIERRTFTRCNLCGEVIGGTGRHLTNILYMVNISALGGSGSSAPIWKPTHAAFSLLAP